MQAKNKKNNESIVKKQPEGIIELNETTLKEYISKDATKEEIKLFLNQCKLFNLNPFKREIYLVKYSKDTPAQFIIGYGVYLKRAEKTKQLDGWEWGTEGEPKKPGFIAWIRIWRKDWTKPFYHTVRWEEYAQYKHDYKTGGKVLTKFWDEKPETQLKKVAASQGFRLCFPEELGDLPYTAEEMPEFTPPGAEKAKTKVKVTPSGKKEKEAPLTAKPLSPAELPEPPDDFEPAAEGEIPLAKEKEDRIVLIKRVLEQKEIPEKKFKLFLGEILGPRKDNRMFVAKNQYGHWSFNKGKNEDQEVMGINFTWVLKQYKKYNDENPGWEEQYEVPKEGEEQEPF